MSHALSIRHLRLALGLLAGLVIWCAAAGSAHAAKRTGTVLSADRASHHLRVVEGTESRRYLVKGKLPRGVRLASRVRYVAQAGVASRVRLVSQGSSVRVRARVVRAKRGKKSLKLGDGGGIPRLRSAVRKLASPASAAATSTLTVGDVSVSLSGFEVGEELQITIRREPSGAVKVDIALTRCCHIPLSPEGGDRFSVTGTILDVDPTGSCDYLVVDTERGEMAFLYEEKFIRRFTQLHYGDVIRVTGRFVADEDEDEEEEDDGIYPGPWISTATVLAVRPNSKPFGDASGCLEPETDEDDE
jgi:hypothetical protein